MRNINQFQTVYSFLIAPIFYLSGVFFPIPAGFALVAFASVLGGLAFRFIGRKLTT